MRRKMVLMVLAVSLCSAAAWAADDNLGTTTRSSGDMTRGMLKNEVVGIKPQVGVMVFTDPIVGNNTSRAVYGFTTDVNFAPAIGSEMSNWFVGPSTGLIFSHLGAPGSNILGTNSNSGFGGSSNFFYIPANLKLGYNFTDAFRLGLHGGGNITYRSVANSLFLGASNSAGTDSTWNIFPNVGADAEFGLGQNVSLMARPDFTITPGNSIFTGTLALGIPLG